MRHLSSLQLPYGHEFIYVDSASEDDSVALTKDFFDQVAQLQTSPNLCASAGRHMGTKLAKASWILYLDADMCLQGAFIAFLQKLAELPQDTGWVGSYTFIDEDLGKSQNKLIGQGNCGEKVERFGGAVLLPKDAVLKAGNWNPGIFANEEIDLYTRLRATGVTIKHSGTGMITHPAEPVPLIQRLSEYFFPVARKKKKFLGFGQVIASRDLAGLANFVRYHPHPFIYWLGLLSTLLLLVAQLPIGALLCLGLTLGFISVVKGPNFAVSYLGLPIRLLLGYAAYDKSFEPTLHRHYVKSNAEQGNSEELHRSLVTSPL